LEDDVNKSTYAFNGGAIPAVANVVPCIKFPSSQHSDSDETEYNIIGESPKVLQMLEEIDIVGPADSTVLILGESGTGKELVARKIHQRSKRRNEPFIEVNCAAIPLGLLESELFGHERGAFTGAVLQRIGRFELARRGTLFLDEIGDIPGELQPKLLRVLQEHTFERLGGTRTIRTDCRIIAATHCHLPQMTAEGKFRADLYYRLNVYPITVAPLRERRRDIPILVQHFTRQFAEKMDKRIDFISPDVMEVLTHHPWPGNIRELQNFIERAVIRSRGSALEPVLAELSSMREEAAAAPITLKDAERAHIIRIVEECDGVIAKAAVRLDVPRSTLFYKMRRLGIGQPRAGAGKQQAATTCGSSAL
jgi:formate hydrogenlyase transcriptional activator